VPEETRLVCPLQTGMTVPMSEADLQRKVITLARKHSWMIHHDKPCRNQKGGWNSSYTGDRGWPDLLLARAGHVLAVELKSAVGVVKVEQADWLNALGFLGRVRAFVWRPEDLVSGVVERILMDPEWKEGDA